MGTLGRYAKNIWASMNDRWLNISTGDGHSGAWRGEKIAKARHQDNRAYATPDYYYIRKILRCLNPGPQDVLYDVGSGKGRILCVAAQWKVKKCVGIEIMDDLCEIARGNAQNARGLRTPIEIRCQDAATADLADGTIYFLFNPFGIETLRDVLENMRKTLSRNPRGLRIVYYNSAHRDVFEAYDWLQKDSTFCTWSGLNIDFYSSTRLEG